MRKTQYSLILFISFASPCFSDCAWNTPRSISTDTLSEGIVKVSTCYSHYWNGHHYAQDTCLFDTSFENELFDTLAASFNLHKNMLICHVDSVAQINSSIWAEDAVDESVHVVIDSCINGSFAAKSLWVKFHSYCTWGCGVFKNRQFVAFVDDNPDSVSDFAINPGHFVDTIAFFLSAGRISYPLIRGVSIDLSSFLERIKTNVICSRHFSQFGNCKNANFHFFNRKNHFTSISAVSVNGRLVPKSRKPFPLGALIKER